MREIKFRAWSKVLNVMNYQYEFGGYFLIERGQPLGKVLCNKENIFELMQFTGLKDKNGKEIYEGDICRAPHDFGPGGFHERQFTVKFDLASGYQWNYWDIHDLEVIGNIYENPELLEEKGK